mmetsp:Transcript_14609/g.36983  ORF Transcript_14609/g.36983 Transcript_14609/m.36983 type:complete len:247 (+) Transcript_14609:337-1077(+)
MDFEESIYSLIPRPVEVPEKAPLYHSQHDGKVDPADFVLGVSKRERGSFGALNGKYCPNPKKFLTKHSKEPILPDPAPVTVSKDKRKAPVPSRAERPIMGLVSSKNFVTANAVEAILSKPRKTNMEPLQYTKKQDYGKIPAYLLRNKAKLQTEKDAVEQYLTRKAEEETFGNGGTLRRLEEEERQGLLRHLKAKWEEVNSVYQKMTFTLDTPAKQKRKENYELTLSQIEKDIKRLEKNNIYIAEDM